MNKKLGVVAGITCLSMISVMSVSAESPQYFSGNVSEEELLQAFTGGSSSAADLGDHGVEGGGTRAIVFGAAAPAAPAPAPPAEPAPVVAAPAPQPVAQPVAATPTASAPAQVACDPSRSVAVNIQFDYDSASIGGNEQSKLSTIAKVLSNPALANCQVVVEGHTDANGSYAYNEQLSERRAQSVVDALVQHNVSSGRLAAVGYGPAVPYNTADPYDPMNRRVEFRLR